VFENGDPFVSQSSWISTGRLGQNIEKILNYQLLPEESNDSRLKAKVDYEYQGLTYSNLFTFEIFNKRNGFKPGTIVSHRQENESGYDNFRNLQFAKYSSSTRNYEYTDDYYHGCKFTIYKEGEIIYQEIRDDCPEVEQTDCRLSDIQRQITIEKEAYLQRVEIRNQNIDLIFVSPLEVPLLDVSQLPNNCLNIYNTYTLAPPILSNFVPLPGAINPYQFIQQIASASGCPPPEYEVICDCDCQNCPDGTCAKECDDHICCYDTSTGQAVLEIPLDQYCGGAN